MPNKISDIEQISINNSGKPSREPLSSGVVALGWVSFVTDVASDMIYPLLPDFLTRVLGAGPAIVGLVEGVAESTASLTQLVSGWWSDRLRRRKPLVVAGYGIAAIARPLIGLATSWTQVLAIRFSDRVGKGIRTAPRDALVADLTPAESRGRAFGLQRAMDNAGAMVGPLLSAALLKFWIEQERTVFLLAFIPGILGLAILLWKVPERRQAPASPKTPATESGGKLPRVFWLVLGVFVLFTLANSTDAFLLLRAQQAGIPIWQIPLVWAFLQGVKAASGVPGGILSDRIGRIRSLLLGWLVYAAAYAAFAAVSQPAAAWATFAFYGLFYGLTEGAQRALVADLVPAASRGRAFGAFHGALGLAALPASILFGIWWTAFGGPAAFRIAAGLALVAAAGLAALAPRLPQSRGVPVKT